MTYNTLEVELEIEAQLDREENPDQVTLPEDDEDAGKEDEDVLVVDGD